MDKKDMINELQNNANQLKHQLSVVRRIIKELSKEKSE